MSWNSANYFTAGGASWGSPLAPGSFYFAAKRAGNQTNQNQNKKPFTQLSLQNPARVICA